MLLQISCCMAQLIKGWLARRVCQVCCPYGPAEGCCRMPPAHRWCHLWQLCLMEAAEGAVLAAAATAESVAAAAAVTNEALGPSEVPSKLAASLKCLSWGRVC